MAQCGSHALPIISLTPKTLQLFPGFSACLTDSTCWTIDDKKEIRGTRKQNPADCRFLWWCLALANMTSVLNTKPQARSSTIRITLVRKTLPRISQPLISIAPEGKSYLRMPEILEITDAQKVFWPFLIVTLKLCPGRYQKV